MGFCGVLGGDGGAAIGILARKGGGVGAETLENLFYRPRTEDKLLGSSCLLHVKVRPALGIPIHRVALESYVAALLAGPQSAPSSVGWSLTTARCGFRCDLQGANTDVALLLITDLSFAVQQRNWSPSNRAGFMGVEPWRGLPLWALCQKMMGTC